MRNIQTFIRVAELQSFTKAAREMNYVQSTVTMQIRQLEEQLGYPLFDRIGKKISLTAPGKAFLGYAYEIAHILEKAGALNTEADGTLRVGVLESLLFAKLSNLLPPFKQAYPGVDLQIKMGQATELLQQLGQNKLDIVYLSADLNTDPDLTCLYKRKESLIFLCGACHPLASHGRLSLQELFEQEFVVTEHSGICYGRLRILAAEAGALLRDSVEVDSVLVIADLLQKGTGLAFLPEYAVSEHLRAGTLVKLKVDCDPQTYYSQILCHKDRWLSPFMQQFVDLIASN